MTKRKNTDDPAGNTNPNEVPKVSAIFPPAAALLTTCVQNSKATKADETKPPAGSPGNR